MGKGLAAIILSKARPKGKAEEEDEDGLDCAVSDIREALERKDNKALKSALRHFVQMARDSESSED